MDRSSRPGFVRVAPRSRLCAWIGASLALLASCASVAATPELSADEMRGVDLALAMRGSLVERAQALRALLPDALRARVLLSLPSFVFDGRVITSTDPDLPGLVDLVRGSTDPVILAVMVDRCSGGPSKARPCDAVQMAERWVQADTQNERAWLTLAGLQQARHDDAAARASFVRAAQASVWRDDGVEIGRYLLHLLPATLSPAERSEALSTIAAIGPASTHLRTSAIRGACESPDSRPACLRVLASMADGASDLLVLGSAARWSARYGVDETIVAQRFARYDAWVTGAMLTRMPELDRPETSDADVATFNDTMTSRLELGEFATARRNLVAAGMTDAEAARRNRDRRIAREAALEESRKAAPR